VNVIEEALPPHRNNINKRIEKDKRNPECKSYDFED
jgi:hypothetical protein